jgi:hypothetical protein
VLMISLVQSGRSFVRRGSFRECPCSKYCICSKNSQDDLIMISLGHSQFDEEAGTRNSRHDAMNSSPVQVCLRVHVISQDETR